MPGKVRTNSIALTQLGQMGAFFMSVQRPQGRKVPVLRAKIEPSNDRSPPGALGTGCNYETRAVRCGLTSRILSGSSFTIDVVLSRDRRITVSGCAYRLRANRSRAKSISSIPAFHPAYEPSHFARTALTTYP